MNRTDLIQNIKFEIASEVTAHREDWSEAPKIDGVEDAAAAVVAFLERSGKFLDKETLAEVRQSLENLSRNSGLIYSGDLHALLKVFS